ncbi:MAG: phosphodiester glycosidase family protein [bacterium]
MSEETLLFRKVIIYTALSLLIYYVCSKTYTNLTDYLTIKRLDQKIEDIRISHSLKEETSIDSYKYSRIISDGILHRKYIKWLNNKPIVINIVSISSMAKNATVSTSYGDYFINRPKTVKTITGKEKAIIGINASYFNETNKIPVGASIVNGEIITGPMYNRVSFGITNDQKFKIDKIHVFGNIKINNKKLQLFNINQPALSKVGFTVYNSHWGDTTPKTSTEYSHIVVKDNKIDFVKNSSVSIPKNGFVLVGLHKNLPKPLLKGESTTYKTIISPLNWNNVNYAVSGGPYLIKDGRIFIDKQKFSKEFLWTKDSRTAIGYTKNGTLILLTVDAIRKGISEGATIYELAKIMWEIGAYESINLDGGKSTQMIINSRLVNYPRVKHGNKVINAIIIRTSLTQPVSFDNVHSMRN